MKKLGITGVILFAFFAFCGHPGLSEGTSGPRMVLKEQRFDAGEIMQGKLIEHTFTVVNQGDQTLEIKQVKPG